MDIPQLRKLKPALKKFLTRFDHCFPRKDTRAHLPVYVSGQLSDIPEKSVEPIAINAGVPPRTLQEFLSQHHWDQDLLRDDLQGVVRDDSRVDRRANVRLLEAWSDEAHRVGLPRGSSFDLDFYTVPANSQEEPLEKHCGSCTSQIAWIQRGRVLRRRTTPPPAIAKAKHAVIRLEGSGTAAVAPYKANPLVRPPAIAVYPAPVGASETWLNRSVPQAAIMPSLRRAKPVWAPPATAMKSLPVGTPDTPSLPQAAIVPSLRKAKPVDSAAAIETKSLPVGTSETSPQSSKPQAAIVPSLRKA